MNCPRCDSLMQLKGFKTFASGITKQCHRCISCKHRCVGEEVFAPVREKIVADYYKSRPLFFFDITFKPPKLSKEQLENMALDCDCDSVFFDILVVQFIRLV